MMKRIFNSPTTILALAMISFIHFSCRKEVSSNEAPTLDEINAAQTHKPLDPGFQGNDMVMYWNDKVATVLGSPMNQPTRARYFAIMEIAVHDALNSIKPKYQRYSLLEERQQFASPAAAVASAAYWAIVLLNRQGSFPVNDWYAQSLATIPDGQSKTLGIALGKKAAESIIAKRADDGFTQVLLTSVNPPDGTTPGAYRHTNFLNFRFVSNWGTVVKPFVIPGNDQFRSEGPYPVTSSQYATDYNEVKGKGARVGSTRTATETTLAKFWSENRPSIIWNNFARRVIESKKMDAWKTARLFALMHTALIDDLNTALEGNYHFYFWRPETAIHEGANDGNPGTEADATWIPFLSEGPSAIPASNLVSPPIPEYPSAYASFGGVTGQVLRLFFETDVVNVDLTSFSLPGETLHYSSISQAAMDNAVSKIYTGWQFRKSVMDGEQQGRRVADYVFAHSFQPAEDE